MPELSQSQADIHVVATEGNPEAEWKRLEEGVLKAVEIIEALKQERTNLRGQVDELRRQVQSLEKESDAAGTQEARVKQLADERDRLLQERRRTAVRVEALIKRIQDLGFE